MLIVPRAGSVVTLGMSDGWSRRPGELGAFLGGLPTSLAPAASCCTTQPRPEINIPARPGRRRRSRGERAAGVIDTEPPHILQTRQI